MSLRNNNKKGRGLITTGTGSDDSLKGSLRKAASGGVAKPTGKGLGALRKASVRTAMTGRGNVGFVFDATASRSHVWNKARNAFQQMFRSLQQKGAMQLRFMAFGGNGIIDREWSADVEQLCKEVSKVKCSGGTTRLNDCLRNIIGDGDKEKPNSIVYVGDHYEETETQLEETIALLKEHQVKVFTFLDSEDGEAEKIFRRLAKQTGGKFARFGNDMPLEDLCEGVALLTVGGDSALSRLENAAARQLLLGGPK